MIFLAAVPGLGLVIAAVCAFYHVTPIPGLAIALVGVALLLKGPRR